MAGSSQLKTGRTYSQLVEAWRSLERTHGVRVTEIDMAGEPFSLLLADVRVSDARPCVALAAGVHGDEPAAPWALHSAVRDGLLDARLAYRIWICTNPTGYAAGTRVNAQGADVNRSFSRDGLHATTAEARAIERANEGRTFELSLDMHEDFEAQGFYCYEPVVGEPAGLGRAVVQSVAEAGLPVQELTGDFDLGYPPAATHLRVLERGLVMPNVEAEVNHFEGLPYSMYLLWTGTARRTMTLETPSSRAWDERIAMHRIAVVGAVSRLIDLETPPA